MNKEKDSDKNKFDFNTNWYDVWMKQSREFFDTADTNLKGIFTSGSQANPEDNMKQINAWLEILKNQWQFPQLNEQQKVYEKYWKEMSKMCADASDMMIKQWMQRNKENNPVRNVRELYEIWLTCCNDVYKNAMHSKSYQESYGEFMNAAIHFWKSAMPK